jgi:hypothetical protein
MIAIITQLIKNIKKQKNTTGNANSEAEYVNGTIRFVLSDIAPGDGEEIF